MSGLLNFLSEARWYLALIKASLGRRNLLPVGPKLARVPLCIKGDHVWLITCNGINEALEVGNCAATEGK